MQPDTVKLHREWKLSTRPLSALLGAWGPRNSWLAPEETEGLVVQALGRQCLARLGVPDRHAFPEASESVLYATIVSHCKQVDTPLPRVTPQYCLSERREMRLDLVLKLSSKFPLFTHSLDSALTWLDETTQTLLCSLASCSTPSDTLLVPRKRSFP